MQNVAFFLPTVLIDYWHR